jgi:hypothetical protein
MPPKTDKERVQSWQKRVNAADKLFIEWEKKYECKKLEEYYYGNQWTDDPDSANKYAINLFFSTIETNRPSTLFYRPQVTVTSRPAHQDDTGTMVDERGKLIEDTLNTFISDPNLKFQNVTRLGLQESNFRYAVVEVGYTANFIDNPNADKPILKEDDSPLLDENGATVSQPARLPESERIYIKRIPAKQWRVCTNEKNETEHLDWCGYFEWHYAEDLKRNPSYRNTSSLKATGKLKDEYNVNLSDSDDDKAHRGMIKLWKIWDLRGRKRYVFVSDGEKFLQEIKFDWLPFADLRPYQRLDRWYPLPPCYNWINPQDEFNEVREMERAHRRRALRRYGFSNGVSKDEISKLEQGGDMTMIELPNQEALWPIQDAPLDSQVFRNVAEAKNDFMEISGKGGEQRGVANADTATQANIIDINSRIRDSYGRQIVAEWLSKIAALMLKASMNMTMDFWVKTNVDVTTIRNAQRVGDQAALQEGVVESARVTSLWKQIKSEDLAEMNMDITVNVDSLSPQAQDQERTNWNMAIATISNPTLLPVFSTSELLLRKTLGYFNIRSEKEIHEIQKQLQQAWTMVQMQAMQKQAGAGAPGMQTLPSPGTTPDNQAIANQIQNQL